MLATNNAYTDAATFKTGMSGVYLYYELATPEEYIIDDFDMPVLYDVDDWGTEEIIPVEGQSSVAPVLELKYGLNAADTLRNLPKNYVSATLNQEFSEKQKQVARNNIGAVSSDVLDSSLSSCVSVDESQSFTDSQKEIARENIGAASVDALTEMEDVTAEALTDLDERIKNTAENLEKTAESLESVNSSESKGWVNKSLWGNDSQWI